MSDAPNAAANGPYTIVVEALTPERGDDAFGRLRLDDAILDPVSGRLEDGLRGIGGLQLFRASSTRSANPTAEGLTARGLAGNAASRILVTLDGVPMSDPFFGFVAWGALAGRPIAGGELIRGGGLGGSGGLAGTLRLRSSDAPGGGRVGLGSRGAVEAEGAWTVDGLTLFGNLSRGDGHRLVEAPGPADVPAAYRRGQAGARVAGMAGATQLSATVSAFDDRRLRGVAGAVAASRGADASLGITGNGRWRWNATLWAQLRDFVTVNRTLDPTRSRAVTALDQFATPAVGAGGRIEVDAPLGADAALRLGGDWRLAEGQTKERFRFVDGRPTRLRRAGGDQSVAGLTTEMSWRPAPPLILTSAGRVDRWRIGPGRLEERDLEMAGALTLFERAAERTGVEVTGRIGAAFEPGGAWRITGAAYRGWRLPTLNELHRPFRAGLDATAANPALEPERLTGVDLGLRVDGARGGTAQVTLFTNRLAAPIANVTVASGPGLFPGVGFVGAGGQFRQRQNLRAIASNGAEADARLSLGAVRGRLSLAVVRARVEGAGLDGLRPAQAPVVSGSAGLAYAQGGWEADGTVRLIGQRFEDDRNQRRLAPAATVDLRFSRRMRSRLSVALSIENLLDQRVETGVSGAQVELGQPRTLMLGLTLAPRL